MKSFAVLALLCAAGSAMADVSFNNGPILAGSQNGYAGRDAGGIFGARMAVFNAAGAGAFYDDGTGGAGANLQNFGATESMGVALGRTVMISSSMTILTTGDQRIHIECFMADGQAFVPAGATVGGAPVSALQFDIGTPNAPADPIDFNSNIVIVSQTFSVGAVGGGGFGPFNPTTTIPGGNGLTIRAGVNAAPDITGFNINSFVVDIVVTKVVPAPGSLALIGLGGLVATRRRRA